MKMPGKCTGPSWMEMDIDRKLKRWGTKHQGEHDNGKKRGSTWRCFSVVQEMFRARSVQSGAEADEPLKTRKNTQPHMVTC